MLCFFLLPLASAISTAVNSRDPTGSPPARARGARSSCGEGLPQEIGFSCYLPVNACSLAGRRITCSWLSAALGAGLACRVGYRVARGAALCSRTAAGVGGTPTRDLAPLTPQQCGSFSLITPTSPVGRRRFRELVMIKIGTVAATHCRWGPDGTRHVCPLQACSPLAWQRRKQARRGAACAWGRGSYQATAPG